MNYETVLSTDDTKNSEDETEVATQNNALKTEDITCSFLRSKWGLDDGLVH